MSCRSRSRAPAKATEKAADDPKPAPTGNPIDLIFIFKPLLDCEGIPSTPHNSSGIIFAVKKHIDIKLFANGSAIEENSSSSNFSSSSVGQTGANGSFA